jgi:Tfp pilus assembly protein PilV
MKGNGPGTRVPASREDGFSLLEVMVAALLLLIVFFGLAQLYTRGRTQMGYEEDRRKATAVAQARLDGIRRDYGYDALAALNGTTTSYTVDGRNFSVLHAVTTDSPEPQSTSITLTVSWAAKTYSGTVTRSLNTTTILARGMP